MTEVWTDERLAAGLGDLGEWIDIGSLDGAVDTRRPHRWALLGRAAAVVVLVAGATLAIAPVRRAVGDLFSIGRTHVEFADPGPLPADTLLTGATPITRSEAERRVGRLPDVARTPLGAPAGYAAVPEGGAVLWWTNGATLWIHRESIDPGAMYKKLLSTNHVTWVDGLGDGAMAIEGNHVLTTPSRKVAARSVVLWHIADTEYRLEADRPLDELIDLAHAIAAAVGG